MLLENCIPRFLRFLRVAPILLIIALSAMPAVASASEGTLSGTTSTSFSTSQTSEVLLSITATVDNTSWDIYNSESVDLTVTLDGKYNQDIVLHGGPGEFTYHVALGPVKSGSHTVQLSYSASRSRLGANLEQSVNVSGLITDVISASDSRYSPLMHSPIIYGRSITGQYENNHTDIPGKLYHTMVTDSSGYTTIEYTGIFSNEDGGTGANTDIGALMARWGRASDIEWVYRVKLSSKDRVVGRWYQGDNHSTNTFTGAKLGQHPLLYTKTDYNTFGQMSSNSSGFRFFLDPLSTKPSGRTREVVMDENPWNYRLMAKEAIAEGKILDTTNDPSTKAVSDLRNYAYLELNKITTSSSTGGTIPVALSIKLKNNSTWYISNHNDAVWSIQRDGSAATTVELPRISLSDGTSRRATAADVEAIKVVAVTGAESYSVDFKGMARAFFLDDTYLPQASFVDPSTVATATLTQNHAEEIVWKAAQ